MSVTKYRVKRVDRSANTQIYVGQTVYSCMKCDYGLASDDSRHTGVEHMSVSLNPEGDYPFFTIPRMDVEEIK